MPLDATFLQSFVSLQMDVTDLREGCSASTMQSDLHCMGGIMDSIEDGVLYFCGYVDRQKAREEGRMRREEERVMREAREYTEEDE